MRKLTTTIAALLAAGTLILSPVFSCTLPADGPGISGDRKSGLTVETPAGADEGLWFVSHTAIPEDRTGLVLSPEDPMKARRSFSLDFDVKFRMEEHCFGYVARIIVNDTLNIDLLANMNADKSRLVLVAGDRRLMDLDTVDFHRGGVASKDGWPWLHVRIAADRKNGTVICELDGERHVCKATLPRLKDIRTVFGLNETGIFASTDVAPMTVKNIRTGKDGKENVAFWTLCRHGDGVAYDEVKGLPAAVRNGVWTIDRHTGWKKETEFRIEGRYPQTATFADETGTGVFAASGNRLYRFEVGGTGLDTLLVRDGHPYHTMSQSLLYNPEDSTLISYTPEREELNAFDPESSEWTNPVEDPYLSWLHHNAAYLPDRNSLVVFGGYGFYRYNADLYVRNPASENWKKTSFAEQMAPRYLSAMGVSGDSLLILGGYGSRSGRQEEMPENFHDLWSVSLDGPDGPQCTMLWKAPCKNHEVFGNSLVMDPDGEHFYALAFANDRANTAVRLHRFSVRNTGRTALAEEIPFRFHDTDSWCTLFCDRDTTMLLALLMHRESPESTVASLWSVDYPVLSPEEVLCAMPGKNHGTGWIVLSLCLLTAGTVAIFLTAGRKSASRTSDGAVSEHPALERSVQDEPVTGAAAPGINLLGGFSITDEGGQNITARFTNIQKSLFLYLLMTSCRNGTGTSPENLNETFWEDMEKDRAANNRNVNMSRLKSLLKNFGGITVYYEKGLWYMNMDTGVRCDYMEIWRLLKACSGKRRPDRPALERIAALGCRGALLPEVTDEWMDRFKSEYSTLLSDVISSAWEMPEVGHDYKLVLKLADAMLANDSIDEPAVRQKCRALFRLGRKEASRQCYENFRREYTAMMGESPDFTWENIRF